MLLRYIVSNFKSIGHSIEFSMFPAKNNVDSRFLKTIETKAGEWKVLRRGGFFGPNAAGKSSFIKSIAFAKSFIINGQKSGKGTGIDQFKGIFDDLKGVSVFQFMFYLDGEVYEYGFSLDRQQVHEEWLMQLTKNNMEPLFSRITNAEGNTDIQIESRFARKNSKDRNLAEVLKDSIQDSQKSQLFLYKLYDNGIKKAEKIINWFKDLQIIFPHTKVQALPIQLKNNEELRNYIAGMLKKMNTGVLGISIESNVIDFHKFVQDMNLPKEMVDDIEEIKNGIVSLNGKYFIFFEQEKRTVLVQIKFDHKLNNKFVQFNMDEESDGTQRLIDLLPMLFSIDRSQSIYLVDEIDRSLHTKLSQFLLNEFVKNSENEKANNQIIFTAHDVNLINLRDFRQDEIWFIEKNQAGETQLRPFSDFVMLDGQDALKAYLNGRFGAIPIIKEQM